MAIKYVDNFEFPPEAGFTGSAGSTEVKGYMRGGSVHKSDTKGMPKKVMKKGGRTHADPGPLPKNVKKRGGHMHDKMMEHGGAMGYKKGGHHDKMYESGGAMGYKKGGPMKMDDMDHANIQRGKKVASSQQDKEFGDQRPVKAGYRRGGKKKGGYNSKPMFGRGSK